MTIQEFEKNYFKQCFYELDITDKTIINSIPWIYKTVFKTCKEYQTYYIFQKNFKRNNKVTSRINSVNGLSYCLL